MVCSGFKTVSIDGICGIAILYHKNKLKKKTVLCNAVTMEAHGTRPYLIKNKCDAHISELLLTFTLHTFHYNTN